MRKFFSAMAVAAGLTLLPATQAAAYTISLYDAEPMNTLGDALAAIAGGTPTVVFQNSIIEFDDLGDGTRGNFGINNAWNISPATTFAAKVIGTFFLATAGDYTFGINHDDGARLTIDGTLTNQFANATDNIDTFVSGNFAAGYHSVEIIYFEAAGGASLEFFGSQGIVTNFNAGQFSLVQSVPEPGSLALVGLSLLGLGASRRRKG